jgi:hypothetical protein
MTRMNRPVAALISLAFTAALMGCGAPSSPPDMQPAQLPPVPSDPDMSVEPSSLAGCEPQTVTVHWDFSVRRPQATTIELWVDSDDGTPVLFASGGVAGSATTGPWVLPGTVFHARDPAAGDEIGQMAVPGRDCPAE